MKRFFNIVVSLLVFIACSGSIYGTSPTDEPFFEDTLTLIQEEEPEDHEGEKRKSYGYAGFSLGVTRMGFSLNAVDDLGSMGFSEIRAVVVN